MSHKSCPKCRHESKVEEVKPSLIYRQSLEDLFNQRKSIESEYTQNLCKCEIHNAEAGYYCFKTKKLICNLCVLESKAVHQIKSYKAVYEELTKGALDSLKQSEKALEFSGKVKSYKSITKYAKESIAKLGDDLIAKITETVNKSVAVLQKELEKSK